MRENVFGALGFTALFVGKMHRVELSFVAQRNSGMVVVGAKDGSKIDAFIWRMKVYKGIRYVSLTDQQFAGGKQFHGNGLSKRFGALYVYERICRCIRDASK